MTLASGRLTALYALMQAPPKLVENPLDSKKDLDRALMTAAEALLSLLIKQCAEPAVSFVAKASALASSSGTRSAAAAGAPAPAQALRAQSFDEPAKVAYHHHA